MTKSSKKMGFTIKFTGDIETKSIFNDYIHEGHFLKIDEKINDFNDSIEYSLKIGMIPDSDHQEFQYFVIGGHDEFLQSINDKFF